MKKILSAALAAFMLALLSLTTIGCSPDESPAGTGPALTISPSASGSAASSPAAPMPAATPEPYPSIADSGTTPRNSFSLSVTLNDAEHKLIVTQSLIYHNNTGTELKEIYFNLIPQAFRQDGGGIDMKDILIGNQPGSLEQVKETVYKLALPSALADKAQVQIDMEYEVRIPNISNRFGYQETVFNLGNFIVTPAVYGADGWVVEPYIDIGDAFYTDVADYDVVIHVPEGYTVAATGEEVRNGLYRAENVRDFAFCASDSYETLSDSWEDVTITVYFGDHMTQTAQRAMETAKNSLELYSKTFGKYPYTTLSIVMSGLTGGVAGMEYPTLIMISPETSLEAAADMVFEDGPTIQYYTVALDNSVCHEIAHQWFYGVVGNDQIAEPWLDEGFCRFCEYLYQKAYPPSVSEEDGVYLMEDRLKDQYTQVVNAGSPDYPFQTVDLDESLYHYAPEEYGEIYEKGGSLLYMMEQQMGETAFEEALKEYVQRFAYGFVTTETFQEFWSSKADFSKLFQLYFA